MKYSEKYKMLLNNVNASMMYHLMAFLIIIVHDSYREHMDILGRTIN